MGRPSGAERPGLAEVVLGWLRGLSRAKAREDAALSVEARLGLGPKKQLVLVNCCGKKVLLAVSGEGIATVMEVGEPKRTQRGRKEAEL
jgi:flagellar biogenesis protein FliO